MRSKAPLWPKDTGKSGGRRLSSGHLPSVGTKYLSAQKVCSYCIHHWQPNSLRETPSGGRMGPSSPGNIFKPLQGLVFCWAPMRSFWILGDASGRMCWMLPFDSWPVKVMTGCSGEKWSGTEACHWICLVVKSGRVQFSSIAQLYPTLCDPMDCSTPGFPITNS